MQKACDIMCEHISKGIMRIFCKSAPIIIAIVCFILPFYVIQVVCNIKTYTEGRPWSGQNMLLDKLKKGEAAIRCQSEAVRSHRGNLRIQRI